MFQKIKQLFFKTAEKKVRFEDLCRSNDLEKWKDFFQEDAKKIGNARLESQLFEVSVVDGKKTEFKSPVEILIVIKNLEPVHLGLQMGVFGPDSVFENNGNGLWTLKNVCWVFREEMFGSSNGVTTTSIWSEHAKKFPADWKRNKVQEIVGEELFGIKFIRSVFINYVLYSYERKLGDLDPTNDWLTSNTVKEMVNDGDFSKFNALIELLNPNKEETLGLDGGELLVLGPSRKTYEKWIDLGWVTPKDVIDFFEEISIFKDGKPNYEAYPFYWRRDGMCEDLAKGILLKESGMNVTPKKRVAL